MKAQDQKIQIIDIVRTFSILPVLVLHQWDHALAPSSSWLKDLWGSIAYKGYYGVCLFFVVSGFLITRLIDKDLGGLAQPNLRAFYSRRAARILPLFFVVVAFGVLMLQGAGAEPGPRQYIFKGAHASLDWAFWLSLPTFSFNWLIVMKESGIQGYGLHWDVLWSLAIEEQFYLLYPLALKFLWGRHPALFLGVVLVSGFAAQCVAHWIRPDDLFLILMNSFTGFGQIATGALLYLAARKYKDFLSHHSGLCFLLCAAGTLMTWTAYFHELGPGDLRWTPTLLCTGLFFFLLGGLHLGLFNSRLLRPLALPGRVSYGMYLWHASILFFLWPWITRMDTWTAFGLFAGATYLVSYLSFRFFETPANHWVRGKFGARPRGVH